MFRKTLFVVLIATLLIMPDSHVSAQDKSKPVVEIKNQETGKKAEITAIEIATNRLANSNDTEYQEYQAEISADLLNSLSAYKQGWDSHGAVLVTIWMYYDTLFSGGYTYLAIDHYATKWQIYDSRVSLRNGYFNMGCQADIYEGGSCGLGRWQKSASFTPHANTVYSAAPYWKGKHVNVSSGYQAGLSHVVIKRGRSTWSLEICIYEGSCGGGG